MSKGVSRSNHPALQLRDESFKGLTIAVWKQENVDRDGLPNFSIKPQFSYYKQDTDTWIVKQMLFPNELAAMTILMLQALKFVCDERDEPFPEDVMDFLGLMSRAKVEKYARRKPIERPEGLQRNAVREAVRARPEENDGFVDDDDPPF